MNENSSIGRFSLSGLAVWRATHLVVEEDGPWDAIVRLRGWFGAGALGRLMDCFYCVSLWIALPLAVFTSSGWMGIAVHWLALSGAASLLEKSTTRRAAEVARLEFLEGGAPCAAVKREAI
jgi:hypothetical protein